MSYRQKTNGERTFPLQILKGGFLAFALCVFFSLLFSLVILLFDVPDKAILPVNQTLKALAITLSSLFSVRGEKGWLKGLIIALISTMLTTFAFSFLGGGLHLSWLIFIELLFFSLVGMLSGVISVNLLRS